MQLQVLSVQHFSSVMALELKAHSHPWSEQTMQSALSRHHCWGLFDAGRLLGFAIFSLVLDESELLDCAIDPASQGRGLGRRLLDLSLVELQGRARRIYLEVRASNAPAIALYQSRGFVEIGVRRGYYPSTAGREDALLMALEVGSPFGESD